MHEARHVGGRCERDLVAACCERVTERDEGLNVTSCAVADQCQLHIAPLFTARHTVSAPLLAIRRVARVTGPVACKLREGRDEREQDALSEQGDVRAKIAVDGHQQRYLGEW